jgi:hypothetical protein
VVEAAWRESTHGLPVLLSEMCLNIILTYALFVNEVAYTHFSSAFYVSVPFHKHILRV